MADPVQQEMHSQLQSEVVIVGGGLSGACLGLGLAQAGIQTIMVDPAPRNQFVLSEQLALRVSALTPESIAWLAQLSVWPKVMAERFCPVTAMHVWDGDGTGQIEFQAATVGVDALCAIVENPVLLNLLKKACFEQENLKWLDQHQLIALVDQQPAGAREILVSDTTGAEKKIHTNLLVGADGALSKVRHLCHLPTREWSYDQKAFVATLKAEKPHHGIAWQNFLPTGPLAFLPMPDPQLGYAGSQYVSIVWSCDLDFASELDQLSTEAFCGQLARASESVLGSLALESSVQSFELTQRHAIDYIGEQVVLVADAAHTIHPLAGQGLNLGLKDAKALLDTLVQAKSRSVPLGSRVVLERFQRARKQDNLSMMLVMEGFKRLFSNSSLAVRWLRNTGLRQVNQMNWLKKQLMTQAMGLNQAKGNSLFYE